MKEVTKMAPGYGLHHHKFKEYLEEGEQFTEIYFNAVIWLGCENLFKRFTEPLPQIDPAETPGPGAAPQVFPACPRPDF